MAACDTLNDNVLDCLNTARAGISRIFIACTCGIDSFVKSEVAHTFTSVVMDTTSDVWYEFEAEVGTKSLNAEGAVSEVGGTPSFTNTIEAKVIGVNKTVLKVLQGFVDARKLTIIIETPNSTGTYNQAFVIGWDSIIGKDASARPNANLIIEGVLEGENSATLIFTAKHAELIREYVGSIITNTDGTVNFGT